MVDPIEAAMQKLADDEEDHGPFLYSRMIGEYDPPKYEAVWGKEEWIYVIEQAFNAKIVRGPHYGYGGFEASW